MCPLTMASSQTERGDAFGPTVQIDVTMFQIEMTTTSHPGPSRSRGKTTGNRGAKGQGLM